MSDEHIFEYPWRVPNVGDCVFYHTMDLPFYGTVPGSWDLRGKADEYLGNFNFGGKRALEIGPASGFLTFEMEARGATVVAVDVTEQQGWDFVPYPEELLSTIYFKRKHGMRCLRRGFWLSHHAHQSKAKVWYGDVCNMPVELGRFDVVVLAAVLLHMKNPLPVMAECAKRADTMIITDLLWEEIEGRPVCRLHPTDENRAWDTWWNFSSEFLCQFARVLGYTEIEVTRHQQNFEGRTADLFTIVASRPKSISQEMSSNQENSVPNNIREGMKNFVR